MSRRCMVTGRKTTVGNRYTTRGIAKKKKGIGLKITGKTKRSFYPNLHVKKIWDSERGCFIKLKLSVAALRTMNKNGVAAVLRKMRTAKI